VQLWTFTSDHPSLGGYVQWLRSKLTNELGEESDEHVEPPVRWTLRDINFVMSEYEPPDMPENATEAVNEVLMRTVLTVAMGAVLLYTTYRYVTRERPQPLRPLAPRAPGQLHEQQQQQPQQQPPGTASAFPRRSPPPGMAQAAAPMTNQWGDPLSEQQTEK